MSGVLSSAPHLTSSFIIHMIQECADEVLGMSNYLEPSTPKQIDNWYESVFVVAADMFCPAWKEVGNHPRWHPKLKEAFDTINQHFCGSTVGQFSLGEVKDALKRYENKAAHRDFNDNITEIKNRLLARIGQHVTGKDF